MAYTVKNYTTKKELKEDFAAGKEIKVYQPGDVFSRDIRDGDVALEGPHYPQPHKWYASVVVKDGIIVKIKG